MPQTGKANEALRREAVVPLSSIHDYVVRELGENRLRTIRQSKNTDYQADAVTSAYEAGLVALLTHFEQPNMAREWALNAEGFSEHVRGAGRVPCAACHRGDFTIGHADNCPAGKA